jgi:AcrR family transcriptional regulator
MEEILKNLDPDKKDRIINSAIQEFSLYPYEKASTNNIVKNAGISKGLLFHYFNNKQDLYEKLIGFVINKLYTEIASQINWEEQDLVERIKKLVIAKMKIGEKYPKMFDFVFKVFSHKKPMSVDDVYKLYGEYGIDFEQTITDIYKKNVDYSLFRNPEDIEKNIT